MDQNCAIGMRHPLYKNGAVFGGVGDTNYALYPVIENQQIKYAGKLTSFSQEKNDKKEKGPYGCARCDSENNCVWCNHYAGFYMTDLNKCTYQAKIPQAQQIVVIILTVVIMLFFAH